MAIPAFLYKDLTWNQNNKVVELKHDKKSHEMYNSSSHLLMKEIWKHSSKFLLTEQPNISSKLEGNTKFLGLQNKHDM